MSKTDELTLSPAIARKLSSVFLISTAGFAMLASKAQTAIMARAEGLPVEFVPNFLELGNRKSLRDKLLAGQDVSRELEFNNIVLDAEEQRMITLIKPILEKVGAPVSAYPWLPEEDHSKNITFGTNYSTPIVQRNNHYISVRTAKGIWERASAFWAGGPSPTGRKVCTDGSYSANRTASISMTSVTIGCQTISRSEIEYIARKKKWEPNV